MSFRLILKLLRVHQYVKNVFIFSPLFFTFDFSLPSFLDTFYAFVLFSLTASSIYIFNDLIDIDEDINHPTKKFRPLASGKISKNFAKIFIVLIASLSLTIAFVYNFELFVVLGIYFLLNIAYSLKLKHITIIDIFIIATGFILRLFAGASVTDTPLSMWIIILTLLLSLFLALAKRRDDVLLASKGKETRKSIDGYNLEFINASMILMSGVVIVAYILYTVSEQIKERFDNPNLYLTSVLVIMGIMRYMQITFVEESSASPTKIVLKDRFIQLTILAWLASFVLILKIV